MDKTNGILSAREKLDRESKDSYELIIHASEYCEMDETIFKTTYDTNDLSTLKVKIIVTDVNDNAPFFDRKVYKIALSPEVIYRDTILEGYVRDTNLI